MKAGLSDFFFDCPAGLANYFGASPDFFSCFLTHVGKLHPSVSADVRSAFGGIGVVL